MFVVADGCIDLGHIGVDACPFLGTAWLDGHFIVVLQRCAFRGRVGEGLVHLFKWFHARCLAFIVDFCALIEEQGANAHRVTVACLCLRTLPSGFSEHLGSVWHLEPFPSHVVVVCHLIDAEELAPLHLPRFGPVAVEACAVGPLTERHFVAEIVACHIFIAGEETVVERSVEVITLVPCHLARLSKVAYAQLCMSLITSCLLTLSGLADVVGQ